MKSQLQLLEEFEENFLGMKKNLIQLGFIDPRRIILFSDLWNQLIYENQDKVKHKYEWVRQYVKQLVQMKGESHGYGEDV